VSAIRWFYSRPVRRTALIAVALLAACSSGGSRAASTTVTTGTTIPVSTLSGSDLAAVEEDGAIAFGTLYARQIQNLDRTVTAAQADCLPRALVDRLGAHHLLELANQNLGKLTPDEAASVAAAFKSCAFTDAQIANARIG
jgi:hypothetical protein